MKHYYWHEWCGTWGLWECNEANHRRCLYKIRQDKHGMWRVDRVDGTAVADRTYVVRYNNLDRAKARCVIEVRL